MNSLIVKVMKTLLMYSQTVISPYKEDSRRRNVWGGGGKVDIPYINLFHI